VNERDIERVGRFGVRTEKGRDDGSVLEVVSYSLRRWSRESSYCGIDRLSGDIVDLEMRDTEALDRERRHGVENMAN
jgi:hypothetical protein